MTLLFKTLSILPGDTLSHEALLSLPSPPSSSSILNSFSNLRPITTKAVQTEDTHLPTINNQSNWTATFPSDKVPNNENADEAAELRKENELLRLQLEKIGGQMIGEVGGGGSGGMNEDSMGLRADLSTLMEQLGRQAEEMAGMKQERESLYAMLRQLQDDLDASEKMRNRSS